MTSRGRIPLGKICKTYATRLGLTVDQNDRRLLGNSSRGEQLLNVHLVAEDVTTGTIVDVPASDVEVGANVRRLGVDAAIPIRLRVRTSSPPGKPNPGPGGNAEAWPNRAAAAAVNLRNCMVVLRRACHVDGLGSETLGQEWYRLSGIRVRVKKENKGTDASCRNRERTEKSDSG